MVEVPLALTAAFSLLKIIISRLQDLLPLAAFLHLTRRSAPPAAPAKTA